MPEQSTHETRPARSRGVRIVHLPPPALKALAEGDLDAANDASPVPLTPDFVAAEWRTVWQYRSKQVEANPDCWQWITGAIWDEEREVAVGHAGFHGPPDSRGMVEVGYAVESTERRQGYARAALEALLQRAADEPDVHLVRVTIAPDNVASIALSAQFGFVAVGEQWDDEDGLEIVYEVRLRRLGNRAAS